MVQIDVHQGAIWRYLPLNAACLWNWIAGKRPFYLFKSILSLWGCLHWWDGHRLQGHMEKQTVQRRQTEKISYQTIWSVWLCGKDTSYNLDLDSDSGEGVKVFEYLLRNRSPGHHVFADRYYTTKKLVDFLNTKSTHYTGTVQTNRVGFPKVIKNKTLKLEHRESKVYKNKNWDLLTVAWQDKKARNCIVTSTKLSGKPAEGRQRRETLQMPTLIHSYDNSMNGCDRLDQCVSYYAQFTGKTIKLWKQVFLWSLEVAQVNSLILWSLSHPSEQLPLLKFKYRLIIQLCEKSLTLAYYVAAESSKRPHSFWVGMG